MLVLSRKTDESIYIDGHIEVTVLEIKGNRVRLGITAPNDVPIHRAEVIVNRLADASPYDSGDFQDLLCLAK